MATKTVIARVIDVGDLIRVDMPGWGMQATCLVTAVHKSRLGYSFTVTRNGQYRTVICGTYQDVVKEIPNG